MNKNTKMSTPNATVNLSRLSLGIRSRRRIPTR